MNVLKRFEESTKEDLRCAMLIVDVHQVVQVDEGSKGKLGLWEEV